ncbi:bifunctional glutamate N-acetyltransferase/amino-acid acetyltransferase ArgJ [Clostridium sp. DJ247]|nr:bifunctional glutamate N-acetyltransferase/amino-acid acetyltransferase ArgJ [Clostridium sp. DJ247]
MKVLDKKTITDIPGILAAGISAGIKKDEKKDLCIIYSKHKATASAVFTRNKAKAAPLIVNMKNIKNDNTQAIVINSGNANSCTGEEGLINAYKMVETAANCLKLSTDEVLVASTGILGVPLPMNSIVPGIEKACLLLSDNVGTDAAEAILTTDTTTKTISVEFELDGEIVMISGMAKGSTMIHPNMGTMLAFIVTNAKISKDLLNKALKASVDKSYNMISVDGDTSTNDMVIVLANGVSHHEIIDCKGKNYEVFCDALDLVNVELAKMIAKDGDGSTKMLEVEVINGKSLDDAIKCAKAIITSNLIKSAIFGNVVNWPRILCALGYSGANYELNKLDIFIKSTVEQLQIVKDGIGTAFDKHLATKILSTDCIKILVNLKDGESCATAWGCDLGVDYVRANAYLK